MEIKIKSLLHQLKILKSLKARIFVIVFLIGIIPSFIIRFAILESYEDRAVSLRTSDVQNQLKIIANHLITYNYLKDTSSEVISAELEQLSNLYDGRVIIINSNLKVIKDTYAISEGKTIITEEVIKCFKEGKGVSNYDRENGYIEMTTPIIETSGVAHAEAGDSKTSDIVSGVMLTGVSTDSIMTTMDILNRKASIMGILMMFIIFVIAMVLANVLIKPFDRVTKAISEVKEGFTDEPVSVSDYLETEHIVDAFNQLINRMKVLDTSRQEFVSNVSHELKTPITSMKVLADSLLTQEEVPAELYREFLVDIAAEIDREDKIINDLLALVKMDKKASSLNISVVDINALTEIILKRLRPIARKRDIEVVFESKRPVVAEVDEVKLTLIITNLVENAIKYNNEQGWVKVILDADYQFFTLDIMDSGIGIPEDSLEHIYERFYRADKSHSREIGGTGLGLSIARNAVLMHRGSIKVFSVEGEGTTFTVKLPLGYISA
ncbi:signal transduction histidine kinase [Kineothrix alysoides]|uniref:histidine kinase n=1 Tax=Kineothrix alysoides TaxID=1469948 RepID=A0A4V2QCJ8_9FIRM|nr:HAMP domain-containing sensor histidine kinase [Kineothrix alysoides]TCL60527.1 signal transduction histidine kinase [Kineothrix alysoides]